jgi:ABC-2 type transport system permease protein
MCYSISWSGGRAALAPLGTFNHESKNMTIPISISHPDWRSHTRALAAIARKDWRQYWRYPLNALSSVFHPIIWVTPVYFMGRAFSTQGKAYGFAGYSGTTDYMSFILLGTVLSEFISAVFWGMGYSLKEDMDAGVLEANWLTPVPRLLIQVGRTLTNLFITTLTSLAMLLIAGMLFGFHPTGNAAAAFLTVLPMLIGLYGFGFAFAAVVLILREANTLTDVSNFLVSTLSGSQFPVNSLPRWLLPIALALPLTYGFDAVRGWLLGTQTLIPIRLEIAVLLLFMVVMIGAGVKVFHLVDRSARQRGTLGQH